MALSQGELDEITVKITAEAQQYINTLNETQKKTQTWATATGVIIGNFATQAFLGAARAGKGFIASSIREASNAQESLSAFTQVFGDQAKEAAKQAEELAKRVGRSATEIKGSLTSQQAFFVGMGFARDRAREMSIQMQALAIDLASFRNLSDEDTINRFRAALSGSSEVLDQFGINIKISALEQEALAQGITKSVSKMDEQEKVMLRIAIIAKSLGAQGAIGDAERTAGQLANRTRSLNAAWTDTKIAVGQAFIPALQKLLPLLQKTAEGTANLLTTAERLNQLEAQTAALAAAVVPARFKTEPEAVDHVKRARELSEEYRRLGREIMNFEHAAANMPFADRGFMTFIQQLKNARRVVGEELIAALRKVKEEADRIKFKDMFTPDGNAIAAAVRKGLMDGSRAFFHLDPQLGKHGFFGQIGAQFNQFFEFAEQLKATGTIRATGGQAVRAGTSEAISLTRIGQKTVSENQKRDNLLTGIKDGINKVVSNGRDMLVALKESGVDIQGVEIP